MGGQPQQLKPKSNHRMCPATDIHWGVHFSQSSVHYRRFIKGFVCIAQPVSEYLARESASKKSEHVSLTKDAMKAFKALKQVCMTAPILVTADYTKPFLLEIDASKARLGAVLSQKQADGWYDPIAYGNRALMPHEKNYHSNKLEFLALKWAITEHFREYLPYQAFVMLTDNNLLMYIRDLIWMPQVINGLVPSYSLTLS